VFGDGKFSPGWQARVKLAHPRCEAFYVVLVQFGPAPGLPLLAASARFAGGQAFLFGLFQGILFNKQALAFVPVA
jgi:hypothetical protein